MRFTIYQTMDLVCTQLSSVHVNPCKRNPLSANKRVAKNTVAFNEEKTVSKQNSFRIFRCCFYFYYSFASFVVWKSRNVYIKVIDEEDKHFWPKIIFCMWCESEKLSLLSFTSTPNWYVFPSLHFHFDFYGTITHFFSLFFHFLL